MTTKMWLPSGGTPPAITPAYSSYWVEQEASSAIARWPMSVVKGSTAQATAVAWENAVTDGVTSLSKQYISVETIPTDRTIDGTVTIDVWHYVSSNSGGAAWSIKVVSSDGLTVRGTLFQGASSTVGTTTTRSTETFALTPVNALAGDRLVIELGGKLWNTTSTGRQANILVGEAGANAPSLDFSANLFNLGDTVRQATETSIAQALVPVYSLTPAVETDTAWQIHTPVGSGGTSPVFVARSSAKITGGGSHSYTVPAHASAAVGDTQVLFVGSYATNPPTSITGGWTQVGSRVMNGHSGMSVYQRVVTVAGGTATAVTVVDSSHAEMRTYRGATGVSELAKGTGLVAPAVTAGTRTLAVRGWSSATSNGSGNNLNPDAALANKAPNVTYGWHDAATAGDGGLGGDSARTATIGSNAAANTPTYFTAGVSGVDPRYIDQASETDTAGAISLGIFAPVGQALETDTAGPLQAGLLTVFEVDTAQPIAPANPPDPFEMPWDIAGTSGTFALDMTNSTLQSGEPNPNGATRTSWLRWTAPDSASGSLQRFHTRGSAPDTTLAVYTGIALGELAEVALSDDASDDDTDLKFVAAAGTTYMIQVGTKSDPAADVVVTWLSGEPSEHDALATPLVLPGQYGTDEFTTANGTLEAGEPVPSGMVASSWLEWTAETAEPVTFTVRSTAGVPFTVTVYTGTLAGGLTPWVSGTGTEVVQVSLAPDPGTTYLIQVGGSDDLLDFEVAWTVLADPVPPVDLPVPVAPSYPALPEVHLRVEVYDRSGQTLITEVPRRLGVQWQDLLNVPGSGQMTVPSDDGILEAYPDLLDWGNVVKLWLGGTCVMAYSIRGRRTAVVKTAEWAGLAITASGPSVHYWLQDFIVRHDGDPRPDSLDTRSYSWASKPGEWYDSAKWQADVNSWTMQNPPSSRKAKKPKNWKVRSARWININNSGGWRYFRRNWVNQVDGRLVRIFATSDEWWRLHLDGEEILSDDQREIGYTRYKRVDTVLSKGQHTFAALSRSLESARGDGNDSFLFAMCEVDLDGRIVLPPLLVSDGSWVGHAGNPPPGWRRAHVLRNVVLEARARGVQSAQRLAFGFDGDADSYGVSWPANDRFNQEVAIGTTALDLQAQLSEGNGFDVWVDPESLVLHAARRRGTDRSSSVTFEPGRNLLDWEVEEQDEVENSWLVQYDGGWTEYEARGSQEDFDVRETYVSLGGVKNEDGARGLIRRAAQGIARAQLRAGTGEIRRRPTGQPEGGLVGVEGAYPFLDFGVGDVVKAPNRLGRLVPQRLLGLTGIEDDVGKLTFDPDMEEVGSGG